jgi:alpha-acetolactate decarboxylase
MVVKKSDVVCRAMHIPSTNNALESTNSSIKKEDTFRDRKGLHEFKIMLLEMASKWSKDYTSGIKKMQTQPIITEKHYADAYDWAKAKKCNKINLRLSISHN